MFNENRVVDDSRNTFVVKTDRLRKYAELFRLPMVNFKKGTAVTIAREDALAIESDDPTLNMDEVVLIEAHGRRDFQGVVFKMEDVKFYNMKDEKVARPFFESIARNMLATFEEDLCACGRIMTCECPKEGTNESR